MNPEFWGRGLKGFLFCFVFVYVSVCLSVYISAHIHHSTHKEVKDLFSLSTLWVWRIELRTFGLVASTFIHWAVSPAHELNLTQCSANTLLDCGVAWLSGSLLPCGMQSGTLELQPWKEQDVSSGCWCFEWIFPFMSVSHCCFIEFLVVKTLIMCHATTNGSRRGKHQCQKLFSEDRMGLPIQVPFVGDT